MYTKQSKKMLPFDILEILHKYTDANHTLSQKEIEKILNDKYDMTADRRSIKRSITDLMDLGLDIQYREIIRSSKDKQTGEEEDQAIWTDFYLERDFSDCEIRLLIDEISGNRFIPARQRKQLISKLEGLSSIYFRKRKGSFNAEDSDNSNQQLFYTIDILDEAISTGKRVSFKYKVFRLGKNGQVEEYHNQYLVTPIDTKMRDDDYMLLCSTDDSCDMVFRINFISDITIENEIGYRNIRQINDKRPKTYVKFLTSEENLSVFVREFGRPAIFAESCGDEVTLSIKMDEKKAIEWGVTHSDIATVIYPEAVRCAVMEKLRGGYSRYEAIGA